MLSRQVLLRLDAISMEADRTRPYGKVSCTVGEVVGTRRKIGICDGRTDTAGGPRRPDLIDRTPLASPGRAPRPPVERTAAHRVEPLWPARQQYRGDAPARQLRGRRVHDGAAGRPRDIAVQPPRARRPFIAATWAQRAVRRRDSSGRDHRGRAG